MNVLFICKANVGRSQIAEAFFNSLSDKSKAKSAGINPPPHWEGKNISSTKFVSSCMSEVGYDVNKMISKRLNTEMVNWADMIFVLGEKDNWPDYLKESGKVEFWDVADPDKEDMPFYRFTRDKIKNLVESIIKSIN